MYYNLPAWIKKIATQPKRVALKIFYSSDL